MKRRKVILIIPEMSMGGAQRSLSKLSLGLARDHQVFVVIFNKDHKIAYPYGGELLSLDVVPGARTLQKLFAFMQRVVRLRMLKKKLDCEVSISFLEGADYVNILSSSNDKLVLSIRGSKRYDETIVGKFFWLRNRILIPWLYRKADVIVTVNDGIARELKLYYGLSKSKILTIGNFYNTDEIAQLSEDPKTQSMVRLYQNPVLVTTGRLAAEKGLKPLIKVFYKLKKKYSTLRLVMIGDGPEYSELIEFCKKLGLSLNASPDFGPLPDVVLLGKQLNVFKYLKGATIYLMNSSSEGFPNGLAEAMVCKVPVVSSDCPYGPREILAPEFPYTGPIVKPYASPNGILLPVIKTDEDENSWVEALTDLLERKDYLSELAENGIERISFFDQKSIMAKWSAVMEDA